MTAAALNFRADGIDRPRPVSLLAQPDPPNSPAKAHDYGYGNVGAMTEPRSGIDRQWMLCPVFYAAGYAGLSNLSYAVTLASRGTQPMNADNQWQLAGTAAEQYQELLVPTVFKPWGTDLVELADLRQGERVLDVACGTGVVARLAAQQVGATGEVTGLDLNADMLRVARARFRTSQCTRPGLALLAPAGDRGVGRPRGGLYVGGPEQGDCPAFLRGGVESGKGQRHRRDLRSNRTLQWAVDHSRRTQAGSRWPPHSILRHPRDGR